LIGPRVREKGLLFEVNLAGTLPTHWRGDYVRTKQIVMNFCSNAHKFTDAGSVMLSVRHDAGSGMLELAVRDTGPGMTEEQISRLFQPFVQADVSTTRRYGGTGLGLHICRQLAERLGGRIDVQTEPGRGSRFALLLPAAAGWLPSAWLPPGTAWAEPQAAPARRTDEPPALCGHVLLAEDSAQNQRLIAAMVQATGATITIVENGAKAVEQALAEDYDLILMDIQMPVMDGTEATTMLRDAGYAGPVIALTANVMRKDIAQYRQAGCTDCLAKPIDRARLYEVLESHLPNGGRQAHGRAAFEAQAATLLQTLGREFLAGLPETVDELERDLAAGNWDSLRRRVHQLKGLAGAVGFPELTRLSQPVDPLIEDRRLAEASTQCALLIDAARQTIARTEATA
jgi:CheY-like chemotaxis protein